MLKVIGSIVGVVVLAVVVVLAIASTRPSTFRVERSIDIAAPAAAVAPLTSDFHNWKLWSPWEHLDPNMQVTFSGAPSGTGAMYDWQGNSKAGKGHMEVTSATPDETRIHLVFYKPFPGDNQATFTFTPASAGTHVDWVMTGPVSFPGKIMTVFMSMDKAIGPEFERGLANMKAVAERR